MCEAVPGAKGATRRRKVYVIVGLGDWSLGRHVQGMSGEDSVSFLMLGKLRF